MDFVIQDTQSGGKRMDAKMLDGKVAIVSGASYGMG
jgi:hypothetical protein